MKTILFIALMLVGFVVQAQNYDFYNEKYKRAKTGAKIGSIFTGTGIGVFIVSTVMITSAQTSNGAIDTTDPLVIAAGFGLSYSFFAFNIGMPLWMTNVAKMKANKKKMDISLGVTQNGVGLTVKL